MLLAVCGVSGCRAGSTIQGNRTEPQSTEQRILEESEKIAEDYRKIYEAAVDKGRLGQREVIGEIVERLGECGYTVVDSANQIDMVNAKEAEAFCLKAQNGQEAEVFLLVVTDEGGFVRYDLRAFQGKIKVRRSLLRWENGAPEAGHLTEYTAYTWSYTEKGYLFLEEYHPSGFDGPSGHTAIRIKPLDASCREWNRKCLEMVGYGANNLFVSDWSEPDFQSLNFCDLYEILYRMKHGRQAPYDFKLGRVCVEIPEKEFEEVFTEYFRVDAGILKQKMTWHEKTGTYQYRARGIYDCGNGTEPPYPEVTDVCENADGTVKLTVHAVWAERNTDCAFSHEVTVRPLENGAFQYVSNHVIPSEMNVEPLWYKERLSDEEWTEAVGGVEISGNSQNVLEKGYNLPINKAEKERASQECLNTMNLIREQYVDSGKNKNTGEILTDEELGEMVQVLCQTGNIVIASGAYPGEMQNYERMESFLNQALAGEKSKETIYEIYPSGTVCRKEFSYDGENLYLLSCTGIWQEGGTPGVSGISRARVKSWRYTEKGWFCYELCVPEPPEVTEIVDGSAMLRVKPLKEEYREIGRNRTRGVGEPDDEILTGVRRAASPVCGIRCGQPAVWLGKIRMRQLCPECFQNICTGGGGPV